MVFCYVQLPFIGQFYVSIQIGAEELHIDPEQDAVRHMALNSVQ